MDEEHDVKEVEGGVSDEHLDGILGGEVEDDEEEVEADTTDEFGNPKEEERVWE